VNIGHESSRVALFEQTIFDPGRRIRLALSLVFHIFIRICVYMLCPYIDVSYVHIYTCVYKRTCVYIYIYTYIYIYIYIYMYRILLESRMPHPPRVVPGIQSVYVYVCIYIYVFVLKYHIYLYIHIYIYVHVCIHIHMYI